jgi:hypothetical protein
LILVLLMTFYTFYHFKRPLKLLPVLDFNNIRYTITEIYKIKKIGLKNTNYINSFLNEGDIFICNNNMKYTIRIIDSYTCHIKVEVYNIKADSIFENLIIYINKEIPSEIIL